MELRYDAHILVHCGWAYVILVWSWDFVFAWLPWKFPRMCLHYIWFLDLRFDRKHQLQHDETFRGIQPVDDPTAEPPLSEKHYKRAVLSIAGLKRRRTLLIQENLSRCWKVSSTGQPKWVRWHLNEDGRVGGRILLSSPADTPAEEQYPWELNPQSSVHQDEGQGSCG